MVKIFVGNLTEECTNGDLQALFGQYGKISDCEKLTDKPFGFVHMEEYNDAQQASRKLHGLAYKGKRLRVELSNSKPCKVFIGNVPHEANSEELREIFENTGLEIHECDKVEGKGFGFAHVASSKGFREINRVIRNLDKIYFKGRHLNIEISDNRKKEAEAEAEYMGLAQSYGYSYDDLGLEGPRGGGFSRGRGMSRGGSRGAPYPVPGSRLGFGTQGIDNSYYEQAGHMNKMRGGYRGGGPSYGAGEVTLEGPFAKGVAGAVSSWAKEAASKKTEQLNKLAEKQAALFHHCASTLLPMLQTGQFSDYKLQCDDMVIDVHKVVLASRSTVFVELILKNPDLCVVTETDFDTLSLLVKFLYSGQVCTDNLSPTRIISLLGAAQKFQVEMVKEGLEAALMDGMSVESVVDYLIIGEELELKDLKDMSLRFIGQRSREMRERDDFRVKLKDYPHLLMELFEAASGN